MYRYPGRHPGGSLQFFRPIGRLRIAVHARQQISEDTTGAMAASCSYVAVAA